MHAQIAQETGSVNLLETLNASLTGMSRSGTFEIRTNLFWRGDAFQALFLVVSGTLKTYNVNMDGDERIGGFHFPGDLLGLDAIVDGRHHWNATPLEPAVIYHVPFEYLVSLTTQSRDGATTLLRWMSQEALAASQLAGDYTATERVVSFLVDMHRRSPDPSAENRVRLPMSRRDIGNYLRLATETVSRTMTQLSTQKLIRSRGRTIELLDMDRLQEIAEPVLFNE